MLKKAVSWFHSSKYKDMYRITDDNIIFNSKYRNLGAYAVCINDAELILKPSIVERNSLYDAGVTLLINNEYAVELLIEELEAWYDVVRTFDLYQASAIWASFILSSNNEEILNSIKSNQSRRNMSTSNKEFTKKRIRKNRD